MEQRQGCRSEALAAVAGIMNKGLVLPLPLLLILRTSICSIGVLESYICSSCHLLSFDTQKLPFKDLRRKEFLSQSVNIGPAI